MLLRISLFWLLSVALLLLCLFTHWDAPAANKAQPINLLTMIKVKPGLMFRTQDGMNLNVLGQVKLPIIPKSKSVNLSDYNTLILTDLSTEHLTQISLNWTVGEQQHQVQLMQAQQSVTPIDFKTPPGTNPTDVYLIFEVSNELGTNAPLKTAVTFNQIQLAQRTDVPAWTSLWSQWSQFTPIKTSSLNAVNTEQNLPSKSLILKLGTWVILLLILYLILKIPAKHLVAGLALAWVIPAAGFLSNQWQQQQQIAAAYQNDPYHINALDRDIAALAERINTAIKATASESGKEKIILVGSGNFQTLRLWRHLTSFDVGISANLRTLVETANSQGKLSVLTGRYIRYCRQFNKYDWLKDRLEVISLSHDYCLARLL